MHEALSEAQRAWRMIALFTGGFVAVVLASGLGALANGEVFAPGWMPESIIFTGIGAEAPTRRFAESAPLSDAGVRGIVDGVGVLGVGRGGWVG